MLKRRLGCGAHVKSMEDRIWWRSSVERPVFTLVICTWINDYIKCRMEM